MAKSLIIAEKPSVANDLARVLAKAPGIGKFTKHEDYYENDTLVISSAVGHLLELKMPEVNGKKIAWGIEHLPILPNQFELDPIEKSKGRFNTLKKLIKRKDVSELINACDAGREGELIFRYLVHAVGVQKPIRRLWMQSMTDQSILSAFSALRSDEEMRPLADAAMCRSESDWLVGINSTRALTAVNSRHGGFMKTPAGRVQTPTLAILVEREREILSFIPKDYWEVFADFSVSAGQYRGRWFHEGFKKAEGDEHAKAERLWTLEEAEAILHRCEGKDGIVEEKTKPTRQTAPLLYDLTSLQREASNRFGFSARNTLSIAQSLYEKHKVLTYPRTDSRYLPEDYVDTVKRTMSSLSQENQLGPLSPSLPPFAGQALKLGIGKNPRVFDNRKVSDHFAIIPTGQIPGKTLSDAEWKIFDMVTRRFISVFFPAAEFEVTTRITRIDKDAFKTEGKVLRVPGWLAVYGKEAVQAATSSEDDQTSSAVLVPVKSGESAGNEGLEITQNTTKPPPRYTEATLLSTMEGAGKLVEDDELREAMSERGLGTPATRASIIEGLIMDQYVARDSKNLVATQKGINLISQIDSIGIKILHAPALTGEWEYKLKQMEQGKLKRPRFMQEIRELTDDIVKRARSYIHEVKSRDYPELDATCPQCGTFPLKGNERGWTCPSCTFKLFRGISGRELSDDEAKTLISKRFLGPLTGFRNRFGKDFDAALELDENHKVTFAFESKEEQARRLDALRAGEALLPCPKCSKKGEEVMIRMTDTDYVCETHAKDRKACPARLPREMCKYEIPSEQAIKLFKNGETDVIEQFISKKGRPFKASLVADWDGKKFLNWKFPPRESNKKASDSDGETPTDKKAPAKKAARKTAAKSVRKTARKTTSKTVSE